MHQTSDPHVQQENSQPVAPLDYAQPARRVTPVRDMILGLLAGICMSLGVGMLTFGMQMSGGNVREAYAIMTGVGAGFVSMALCIVGLMLFLRHSRR